MLSYRHAFHAGNHGDVLKHMILVASLTYLNQKDKPYCYVDTHAGAGKYLLTEGYATQNAEYKTGIERLWRRNDAPPLVAQYLDVVKSFQESAPQSKLLRCYPGSPLIAQRVMRVTDTLRLFEAHPTDGLLLTEAMKVARQNCQVRLGDGFAGIKAVLPPPSRRGLILIDPPYELKNEYPRVVEAVKEGLKRFATGTYMVWYPCLQRSEIHRLLEGLQRLPFERSLHVRLTIKKPPADGFGLFGSGVFLGNPAWTLADKLRTTLPYLVEHLGEDEHAEGVVEG